MPPPFYGFLVLMQLIFYGYAFFFLEIILCHHFFSFQFYALLCNLNCIAFFCRADIKNLLKKLFVNKNTEINLNLNTSKPKPNQRRSGPGEHAEGLPARGPRRTAGQSRQRRPRQCGRLVGSLGIHAFFWETDAIIRVPRNLLGKKIDLIRNPNVRASSKKNVPTI